MVLHAHPYQHDRGVGDVLRASGRPPSSTPLSELLFRAAPLIKYSNSRKSIVSLICAKDQTTISR
jgi:hypothetical protein